MKKIFHEIKFLLPTFLVLIIVFFFWDKISFEYKNLREIKGYYSLNKYSVLNDNIRYILSIFFPTLIYFLTYIYRYKINPIEILNILKFKFSNPNKNKKISFGLLIVSLIIALFYFLSLKFNSYPMDLFHEGQILVGAKNYEIKKKLWEESYIVTSLFIDILYANIAWKIFNIENVVSTRILLSFLNLGGLFVALIFVFNFINETNLRKEFKIFAFLILSISIFYFFKNGSLGFRDLPLFFFFILLINNLKSKKILSLTNILIGFLPLVSILWSLDRGVFLILLYLFLFIFLIINKRFNQVLLILFTIIASLLIFVQIIGITEFKAFIINSYDIIISSDLLNGLIHPKPFSNEINSSRASKSLIIIIINSLILINILFNKSKNHKFIFKILLLFFYLESIIYYKIGITRSDGGHIKQGSSLSYFTLIIFITYLTLIKIQEFNFKKKYKIIFFYIHFIVLIGFIVDNFNKNQFYNIITFNKRIDNYLKIQDKKLINDREKDIINRLIFLLKDEKCFQVFTYETAIQYFVKKPTCTNYYHIMNLGSKNNQLHFIKQIEKRKPTYFLVGGSYRTIGNYKGDNSERLSPEKRFQYIDRYIKKNYIFFEKINSWIILKKTSDK